MKKFLKSKKETEQEKRNRVAQICAALDAFDKGIKLYQNLANKLDNYITEALLQEDKKSAEQFARMKVRVYNFVKRLRTFKMNFEVGAVTTQALSQLSTVTEAILACGALFVNFPTNIESMGEGMKDLFDGLNTVEQEFEKINEMLTPSGKGTDVLPEDHPVLSEEEQEQVDKEMEAAMQRVSNIIGSKTVETPAFSKSDEVDDTGNIDFEGLIRRENNGDTDR